MANIGELPNGILGTAPKFGLRETKKNCPCIYVLKTKSQKEQFNVVFVQVVKKSALHVQNFCFHLLIGLVSLCVNG